MYAGICSERAATIDLSARMSVFPQAGCIPASICLPKQKGRKEKSRRKKRLQPRVGLAAFSVSFPWPFHSATSAETSIHSSCSSQLVNLNTLLFFAKGEREVGREREWRRDGGGEVWGGAFAHLL